MYTAVMSTIRRCEHDAHNMSTPLRHKYRACWRWRGRRHRTRVDERSRVAVMDSEAGVCTSSVYFNMDVPTDAVCAQPAPRRQTFQPSDTSVDVTYTFSSDKMIHK
jgi:hypothetical protein